MKKPKVLCVCTMGLNRSKYLAKYLKNKGYKTKFGGAGPFKYEDMKANLLKKEDVEWADVIIAVRPKHGEQLKKNFKLKGKRVILLDVTDSQRKIAELHPKFKDMDHEEFNRRWTYSELRKAVREYLPL